MGKSNNKRRPKQFIGMFYLEKGQPVVGELRLKGAGTLLKLHAEHRLKEISDESFIEGRAYSGEHITLIDCYAAGSGESFSKDQTSLFHANVFPHHVVVANRSLDPRQNCITAIHFTTNDLPAIAYDFDAFGLEWNHSLIDAVLEERRKSRAVETGEWPAIAYFTGRHRVVGVLTSIGKISINHRPSYVNGGCSGVNIKNRMVVSIEFNEPVPFDEAINRISVVSGFLSATAGRVQEIYGIEVSTSAAEDELPLHVHSSFQWKKSGKYGHRKPHPADVPLDPIGHRAEFEAVLTSWVAKHESWAIARAQYFGCMRKGNKYSTSRLVAAANMFDILPSEAVPVGNVLSEELVSTREACRGLLRKLPNGIDRNSALNALGRLGKPSLPKKVAYRSGIVENKLGRQFPDLGYVANVAVKCRNFFVHGSSEEVDYSKVEPFVPFLTDTLEFVFGCSDLIEAGWDTGRWASRQHGLGHSFTRYRHEYLQSIAELRVALGTTQELP